MRKLTTLISLILCAFILTAQAEKKEAAQSKKLLVQKVEAAGVEEAFARSLEEALVLDIGGREGISVVTSAEMQSVVKTVQLKAETGCEGSDECLVEVQKKLDVETLIAGKVTKLGDEFIFSINTVNVANKTVGERISIQGKDLNDVKGKIKESVDIILGISAPKEMFKLADGEELRLAVMPLTARGMDIFFQVVSHFFEGSDSHLFLYNSIS